MSKKNRAGHKIFRSKKNRRVTLGGFEDRQTAHIGRLPSALFFTTAEWREARYLALKRANGKCQFCGQSPKNHDVALHVDHIRPRSLYPYLALDPTNLQVLCETCNLGKGNKDRTDWRR